MSYKAEPHKFFTFGKKTRIPYQYCVECGFVYMKNELSEWVAKQGCNHKDHPSYKSKLGITNPFTK